MTDPTIAAHRGCPPMGWNSWHTLGVTVDERAITETAQALVDFGMRDAGYEYVIVDDGWSAPDRDSRGSLRADPHRFPNGIDGLADQVHDLGLKFGLYASATDMTCAQRAGTHPGATGSGGHEHHDAATFASWGVDYLKYDWCSPAGSLTDQIAAFTRMRDALHTTGRPIVYSINPNSRHPAKTGASHDWSGIANLWRATENITPAWDTGSTGDQPMGVLNIAEAGAFPHVPTRPHRINDPDSLVIGLPGPYGGAGLTRTEARAHLGLWALMAAPLIAGNDVRRMPDDIREILLDPDPIAIDQDPLVRSPDIIARSGGGEVWRKPLADGSTAVGLLNRADHPQKITATDDIAAVVPPHGLALFQIGPD